MFSLFCAILFINQMKPKESKGIYMKQCNLITSLLLILLLLSCTSCWEFPSAKAAGTTYVALGDSITEGTGMKAEEDTFVCHFTKELKQLSPDIQGYNLGKEGDTVSETLKKVQQEDTSELLRKASYITITAGGNDILAIAASAAKEITGKNYRKATKIPNLVKNEATAKLLLSYLEKDSVKEQLNQFLDAFTADFHNLIQTVQTKSPNAVVLVQTVYNPASGSSYKSLAECIDIVLTQINAIITDEVYEQDNDKLLLCDTYTLFANQSEQYVRINEDDIHPTAKGHKMIAEALMLTLSGKPITSLTTEEPANASTASSTPALSEHASAKRTQTGKRRFLTWAGTSFVCGLVAFMLLKLHQNTRRYNNR